jgi:hypothetical protein
VRRSFTASPKQLVPQMPKILQFSSQGHFHPLSSFYPVDIVFNRITFPSTEHVYQANRFYYSQHNRFSSRGDIGNPQKEPFLSFKKENNVGITARYQSVHRENDAGLRTSVLHEGQYDMLTKYLAVLNQEDPLDSTRLVNFYQENNELFKKYDPYFIHNDPSVGWKYLFNLLFEILLQKFIQDPFRVMLLSTDDLVLQEIQQSSFEIEDGPFRQDRYSMFLRNIRSYLRKETLPTLSKLRMITYFRY